MRRPLVLAVDDTAMGRRALEVTLGTDDWDLELVAGGQEALDRAEQSLPDLILLDVMMPGMDGYEVCRRIRQHPVLSEVPVIMITGLEDRDSRLKGLKAGADDFVSKPFDREELRARVATITRLNRYRRLLAEQEKLRRLFEVSPDGIVVVNSAGTILISNNSFETITDRQWERGASLYDALPEQSVDRFRTIIRDALSNHEATAFDDLTIHGTGGEMPVSMGSAFCEWDGEPAVELIVRDITERVQMESQLSEALHKAEGAARTKSAFLANMSHEIRTPMNGVLGIVELLMATDLDPQQRQFAETIRTSGDALLAILNDILDVSKIDAGKMDLESITFDLHDLVTNAARIHSVTARENSSTLDVSIEPDVPIMVKGDPGRIRQVVSNLVSNAVKFTEDGAIQVSITTDGVDGDVHHLRFSVSDTGHGIPPDKMTTIFDEFTQADASTTRKFGGTGLGLTICNRLVEMMGGDLQLQSVVGKGSTFFFTLPMEVDTESPPPEDARSAEGLLKNRGLLLVEPESASRASLRAYLEPSGLVISETDSLAEAALMLRLQEPTYDVVLMSGEFGGAEFGFPAKCREDRPDLRSKFIVISATGVSGDGKSARDGGVSAYLTKPVTRLELTRTVALTLMSADERGLITRHQLRSESRPLHVLLAEDSAVNQQVATTLLTKHGHTVDIATNGLEAVAMAAAGKYDVVLMDLQMPELDGFEAAERILAAPATANLPIIALTAHAIDEERDRCLKLGMIGFLMKPFKPVELFEALEEAAAGLQPRTDAAAETPQSDESVLPPIQIASFRSEMKAAGAEEVVDQVLSVFASDTPNRLSDIRKARAEGNYAELARVAHALKSASGSIRATRLYERLQLVENAARVNNQALADSLVDEALEEADRVLAFIAEQ